MFAFSFPNPLQNQLVPWNTVSHIQYFDYQASPSCLVYKIEKHLTLYCAGKQSINKTLKEAKKKKKSYMKCFRNCKALSTLGGDVIIRDLGLRERLPFLCCPSSPFRPWNSLLPPEPSKAPFISRQSTKQTASWASFKGYQLHFPVGILSFLSAACRNAWATSSLSCMENYLDGAS